VLGASQAEAQSRIVIGGGSTLGMSDIKETANGGFNNGPHLILGYEYVSAGGFGFRVDGMYHRISGDDVSQGTGPALSSNLQVMNGTANLLYVLPTAGNFKPYLIAGIGYYSFKPTGDAYTGLDLDTTNDIGFNAGAGFEAGGAGLKFFGEARFHQIQSNDTAGFNPRVLPISVGVKIPLGAS